MDTINNNYPMLVECSYCSNAFKNSMSIWCIPDPYNGYPSMARLCCKECENNKIPQKENVFYEKWNEYHQKYDYYLRRTDIKPPSWTWGYFEENMACHLCHKTITKKEPYNDYLADRNGETVHFAFCAKCYLDVRGLGETLARYDIKDTYN